MYESFCICTAGIIIALIVLYVFFKSISKPSYVPPQQVHHHYHQQQTAPGTTQIIKEKEVTREIVKIRCQYCGNLYEERADKCPHCGGR